MLHAVSPLSVALLALAVLYAPLNHVRARNTDVRAAPLTRAQVVARLDSASVDQPASFAGEDLSGLDLSGLDFKRASLARAKLVGTKMAHAKMFGVKFDSALASHADLSGATLDV